MKNWRKSWMRWRKPGITVFGSYRATMMINNPSASVYSGGDRYPAEPTAPEDFERIYKEFGYSEASSRDANSLSYTYDLGPSMRLLMLDTCQYGTPQQGRGNDKDRDL